ncbi:MAG: hypothetical protein IJ132_00685 [Firmicutes bacterium]|nr:hypothetical protein [Bacillota bacterium]
MREVPVYMFTGFLGSGKTTFIKDTLESHEFGVDARMLLLVCERGEVDYEPEKFADLDIFVEQIKSEDELNDVKLGSLAKKHDIDMVVVEYNGMWENQKFFAAMPEGWLVAQEMSLFDAKTFLMYNKNMRQLCFNQMQTADMVVFNRCEKGFDKMPYHKEVRIANRRNMIVYEYGPNDIEPDDIIDPLPYDMSKSRIKIEDEWYAEWYRDINENEDDYEGKTLDLKGRVALSEELPDGQFAFGRHVMTCCEADIQFAGLLAYYSGAVDLKVGDWVEITAKVRVEYTEAYKEKGPVLYIKNLNICKPCEPEVATF